eukprot:4938440-Pleurochrysis_carterae.AAC.1
MAAALAEAVEEETRAALAGERAKAALAAAAAGVAGAGGDTGLGRADAGSPARAAGGGGREESAPPESPLSELLRRVAAESGMD